MDTERARPHFVRRVVRFALPAGAIAGTVTLADGLISRQPHSGPEGPAGGDERGDAAPVRGLDWVLAVVARPWTPWRAVTVLALADAFLLVPAGPCATSRQQEPTAPSHDGPGRR